MQSPRSLGGVALGGMLLFLGLLAYQGYLRATEWPQLATQPLSSRGRESGVDTPGPEAWIGVLLPSQDVDLASPVDARLDFLRVRLGDRVKKGDSLARVDTRELSQGLRMAQAQQSTAAAELERAKDALQQAQAQLSRSNQLREHLSAEALEQDAHRARSAEAEVAAAIGRVLEHQAHVSQLQHALEASDLRAPFDGVVSAIFSSPGSYVRSGVPVLHLVSGSPGLVRFAVPEEAAPRLRLGAPVQVRLENPPRAFMGIVDRVAPEVDVASRRVFAEATLQTTPESRASIVVGAAVEVALSDSLEVR
jgi:RND family efflux transporter MFP subunit